MAQQLKDPVLSLQQLGFAAMAWVLSLAWELPHATAGYCQKKKKEKKQL